MNSAEPYAKSSTHPSNILPQTNKHHFLLPNNNHHGPSRPQ